MDSEGDRRPHGGPSRWGYRTPSPDYTRREMSPISPPQQVSASSSIARDALLPPLVSASRVHSRPISRGPAWGNFYNPSSQSEIPRDAARPQESNAPPPPPQHNLAQRDLPSHFYLCAQPATAQEDRPIAPDPPKNPLDILATLALADREQRAPEPQPHASPSYKRSPTLNQHQRGPSGVHIPSPPISSKRPGSASGYGSYRQSGTQYGKSQSTVFRSPPTHTARPPPPPDRRIGDVLPRERALEGSQPTRRWLSQPPLPAPIFSPNSNHNRVTLPPLSETIRTGGPSAKRSKDSRSVSESPLLSTTKPVLTFPARNKRLSDSQLEAYRPPALSAVDFANSRGVAVVEQKELERVPEPDLRPSSSANVATIVPGSIPGALDAKQNATQVGRADSSVPAPALPNDAGMRVIPAKEAAARPRSKSLAEPRATSQPSIDEDKSEDRPVSLPTPTQEDHVIQDSVSVLDAVAKETKSAPGHDIAKLTPEAMEGTEVSVVGAKGSVAQIRHSPKTDGMRYMPQTTRGPTAPGVLSVVAAVVDAGPMPDPVPTRSDAVPPPAERKALTTKMDIDSKEPAAVATESVGAPKELSATPETAKALSEQPRSRRPSKTSRPRRKTSKQPSGSEVPCPVCGILYSDDDGSRGEWIGCDGCKRWQHGQCVNLDPAEAARIDKYFCTNCEVIHGPSTMKRTSNRAHTAIDYSALHNGSSIPLRNPEDSRIHPYISKIKDRAYPFVEEKLARVRPECVTSEYLDNMQDGWNEPFIIPAGYNPAPWHRPNEAYAQKPLAPEVKFVDEDVEMADIPDVLNIPPPPPPPRDGELDAFGDAATEASNPPSTKPRDERRPGADLLDMIIPPGLTVRKVAEMIGMSRRVDVFKVLTQQPAEDKWTMEDLVNYFENPVRETVYNCISCEVTNTPLGAQISRPRAVRETDLVDRVWRESSKHVRPTVGKYVLMSVRDSFTDFHVDFGGSSVFYHIYEGQKVFLTIPPTDKALKVYEEWNDNPDMNNIWLPDLLPDHSCLILHLKKGDTLLIPSGWIHAVYTPVDTLVIGGNFLTKNHFVKQMAVQRIEVLNNTAPSHRYPRYTTLMWHCLYSYCQSDPIPPSVDAALLEGRIVTLKNGLEPKGTRLYTMQELEGLPALLEFLHRITMVVEGVITTSLRRGSPKVTQKQLDTLKRTIPEPINRDPLAYIKVFARWVTWKRACYDINPDGEILPEWAHKAWRPPAKSAKAEKPPKVEENRDSAEPDAPRRTLRDRRQPSKSPELFPPPPKPQQKKRKPEGSTAQPSKKPRKAATAASKSTSEASASAGGDPPMLLEDGERITLSDGCIYVRKNSNLGPPRAGCQNCRLKKTGCKHKDEIAEILKGTWSGPSQASLESWAAKLASTGRDGGEAGEGEDEERQRPKLGTADIDENVIIDDEEELTDIDEAALARHAQRKAAEAQAKREHSPKRRVDDSQVEPPKKRAKSGTPSTAATADVIVVNGTTEAATEPFPAPTLPSAANGEGGTVAAAGPPAGYKGRKPSCNDCKALKKKCLHQDTWALVTAKPATPTSKSRRAASGSSASKRRKSAPSSTTAPANPTAPPPAAPFTSTPPNSDIITVKPTTPTANGSPDGPSSPPAISPARPPSSNAASPIKALSPANVPSVNPPSPTATFPVKPPSPTTTLTIKPPTQNSTSPVKPETKAEAGDASARTESIAPPMDVAFQVPATVLPSMKREQLLQRQILLPESITAGTGKKSKVTTYATGARSFKSEQKQPGSPEEGVVDPELKKAMRKIAFGLRNRNKA